MTKEDFMLTITQPKMAKNATEGKVVRSRMDRRTSLSQIFADAEGNMLASMGMVKAKQAEAKKEADPVTRLM